MPARPTSQEVDVRETETTTMATDPVCGMQVDPDEAAGTSEHNGETVYFCSLGCKQQFDATPERYVGQQTAQAGASASRQAAT